MKAQRRSEAFRVSLLAWRHSGFSVYGEQVVLPDEKRRLGHLARYLTRPPLASRRVQKGAPGSFLLTTPIDPSTGATQLVLDPLELIHRLVQQIPDPRQHIVRYYGAYANRARRLYRAADEQAQVEGVFGTPSADSDPESEFAEERRRSWARLLRKILEVDPLLFRDCGVEMTIVSVITETIVVDAILRHIEQGGGRSPHEPRAPPAA